MNQTRTAALLIGMISTLIFVSAANATTLEEVAKTLEDKCRKLESCSGKVVMKTHVNTDKGPINKTNMYMSFEWMRDGEKQLYRREGTVITERYNSITEMLESDDDDFVTIDHTLVIFVDGTECSTSPDFILSKIACKEWDEFISDLNGLNHLMEDQDCKLLPDRKVGKYDCYVIEATPKKKESGKHKGGRKTTYCFDKESGIVVQIITFDDKGRKNSEMNIRELKLNPELSKARFRWIVPEDALLMNLLKEMDKTNNSASTEETKEEKKN